MTEQSFNDVILLSIRSKFAKQIFEGKKGYEFRKPKIPDDLTYIVLMEEESRQIVGGIKVGRIIKADIDTLWEEYAKEISKKERFYNYYDGWNEGLAIEVEQSEKFDNAISSDNITDVDTTINIPDKFPFIQLSYESIDYLSNHSDIISNLLDERTELQIRGMQSCEESEFRRLVSESQVPDEYAEIDNTFTDHIIESHNKGKDPYGYFTLMKNIHTLIYKSDVAGFTVTTWKRGHSVKYGPTVLKEEYQGRGLGPRFRKKLDRQLKSKGVHKVYSTIPEHAANAYNYLIDSGYQIEAHMRRQYNEGHNELVFGKLLSKTTSSNQTQLNRAKLENLEFNIGSNDYHEFGEFVIENMEPWYSGIDDDFICAVQEAEGRDLEKDLSKKGKRVYIGTAEDDIKCVLIASRKRGGAIKLSPLLTTVSGPAVGKFLQFAEDNILESGSVRKFYSHVPLIDTELINEFKSSGYEIEGVIREPYKKGVDMVFLGKFNE